MAGDLGYDPYKIETIVEYAHELVGHTLREKIAPVELQSPKKRHASTPSGCQDFVWRHKS